MGDSGGEPRFFNREPKTREEREAGKDKDALEKLRLRQRKGGFYRADCTPNPIVPDERSAAYATEAERFHRDFAQDDYERRIDARLREEDRLARKRTEQYYKEQARWDAIDGAFDLEMTRQAGCQTRPVRLNNAPGDPVNTLTQRYTSTAAGQALRAEDDRVKWRGEMRRQLLWERQQSQEHNIITGAPIKPVVSVPQEPPRVHTVVAPWEK